MNNGILCIHKSITSLADYGNCGTGCLLSMKEHGADYAQSSVQRTAVHLISIQAFLGKALTSITALAGR